MISDDPDDVDVIGGNHPDLMMDTSCLIFTPADFDYPFQVNTSCPPAKGICKFKLVEGHEPIKNSVSFRISSSEKSPLPPTFDGQGTIKLHLLPDGFVPQRFIEITFTSQIVISGLKFEMPESLALGSFVLLVEEAGIQSPNIFTQWGVSY